jgi:hypothetical protein
MMHGLKNKGEQKVKIPSTVFKNVFLFCGQKKL